MAHPAQAHARLAVAATALTDPARHVAALTPPAEPAPCVRRVYGGYAEVDDGCRRRWPPTELGLGLPCELAEAAAVGQRADGNERRQRTRVGTGFLQGRATARSSALDSCRYVCRSCSLSPKCVHFGGICRVYSGPLDRNVIE